MHYLKVIPVLSFLLFSALFAGAQPGWKWGRAATAGVGPTEGFYCTTDAAGGVYGVGVCNGGVGYFGTDSTTGKGVYVVKYDSTGNFKWVVQAKSFYNPTSLGICSDHFGNQYILGTYYSSITMGGFTLTPPYSTYNRFFIAKTDSTGHVKWLKNVGDVLTVSIEEGSNIATDDMGNFYITGCYRNNPVIGADTLVNDTTDNSTDVFVAKFDSSGAAMWAKGFGGKKFDFASGIAVSQWGEVYIAGYFNSPSILFGSTLMTDTGSARGSYTLYFAKLDTGGNPIWVRGNGGTDGEISGIAIGTQGSVYVTGYYHNTTQTLGSVTLPFAPFTGTSYGFVAKYDSSGGLYWAKPMRGKYVQPFLPAVDGCGNVWVVGNFGSLICTDTIDGHVLSSPAGTDDAMFIAGWTDMGLWLQADVLSSGGDDRCGIDIDYNGNLLLVGDYRAPTFTVGSDVIHFAGPHEFNFVAKYNPALGCITMPPVIPALQVSNPGNQREVVLYPNPAYSSCTVSYMGTLSEGASISIYDLTGRHMLTQRLTGSETTISIASLPQGMYVCRIDADGSGVVTRKLTVMR